MSFHGFPQVIDDSYFSHPYNGLEELTSPEVGYILYIIVGLCMNLMIEQDLPRIWSLMFLQTSVSPVKLLKS